MAGVKQDKYTPVLSDLRQVALESIDRQCGAFDADRIANIGVVRQQIERAIVQRGHYNADSQRTAKWVSSHHRTGAALLQGGFENVMTGGE
jgi:hypothetical protein